jgi:hypothetical protein
MGRIIALVVFMTSVMSPPAKAQQGLRAEPVQVPKQHTKVPLPGNMPQYQRQQQPQGNAPAQEQPDPRAYSPQLETRARKMFPSVGEVKER